MVHVKVPGFLKGELWLMIATGCMLVGGVLAAVTTGVSWAGFTIESSGSGFGDFRAEVDYKMSEFEVSNQGFTQSVDYSEDQNDDEDGIGLMRAAGPLMIVGIVLTFVSMAALATSLFVRGAFVTLGGSIGAALAVVFLLLALIFLPIGIQQNYDAGDTSGAGFSGDDLGWGAGLYLGIFGTAFALAGAVMAFMARFAGKADLS